MLDGAAIRVGWGAAILLLLTASAAAQSKAPPFVPSDYELRRLETQLYLLQAQKAAEARRKSRQKQYVGAGQETGADPAAGTGLRITPAAAVRGGLLATVGLATIAVLSEDTSPILEAGRDDSGGGSPATGPGAAPVSTR